MGGLALLSTPPSAPRACVPLSLESGSWQEWSLQDVSLFDAAIFAAAGAGIFALTARGGTSAPQPSASYARDPMELDGVALPFLSPRRQQLRFSVLSKMIVDTIDGAQRPGGGGVQAAVGATLAVPQLRCALHAPVGCDFDAGMLALATSHGVEPRLARLDDVATTPGEIITYDSDEKMTFKPVGWESWDDLMAWQPPADFASSCDALHVIVEGGGGGEVDAALNALAATPSLQLSAEPVMQEVTPAALDGLRRLTRRTKLVSPDLPTAWALDQVAQGRAESLRPADVDGDTLAAARADAASLADRCFAALAMPDDAVLSIRDGARGSLLYGDGWFARVPAVELDAVADPTGAGNAFAGALAAGFVEQRARAQPTREAALAAAAVATAVGAAMCKTSGWAPDDVAEARKWVERSSARIEIT